MWDVIEKSFDEETFELRKKQSMVGDIIELGAKDGLGAYTDIKNIASIFNYNGNKDIIKDHLMLIRVDTQV
ncbi:hypothetical protein Tco_0613637 [Tanacetum coccineum]